MAVPDWPTTYGYNMFFFPFRLWEGGIFHEHLHRLVASGLGLLTLILATVAAISDSRKWVRVLSVTAAALVVIQGLLGGLRVQLNSYALFGVPGAIFFGVLHATLAQCFLSIICVLTVATSRYWAACTRRPAQEGSQVSTLATAMVCLTLVQLVIAASMRHQHAGLAIPDFPLAYGHIYPPTGPEFLETINQRRLEVIDGGDVTPFQIHLQMAHRGVALVLVTLAAILAWRSGAIAPAWRTSIRLWASCYGLQFLLGAATIWTNKAADVATAHVALGAVTLSVGVALSVTRLIAESQSGLRIAPCSSLNTSLKTSSPLTSRAF